ncbi:11311_t:CDS:2, partial [Entrophospora sp. SA101]
DFPVDSIISEPKLYVSDLQFSITENELRDLFEDIQPTSVQINRLPGNAPHTAVITFATIDHGEFARGKPKFYQELVKKCIDSNPINRSTATDAGQEMEIIGWRFAESNIENHKAAIFPCLSFKQFAQKLKWIFSKQIL